MATKKSDDPFTPVNYDSYSEESQPVDITGLVAPNITVPETKEETYKLPSATKTPTISAADRAYKTLEHAINMMGWEDKLGKKLRGKLGPPPIQSWEEVKAQIPDWDQRPNSEQRKLYDNYVQGAVDVMNTWNEGRTKTTGKIDVAKWEEEFRKANPGPEKIQRSWMDLLGDIGTNLASGAFSLPMTASTMIDLVTGQTRSEYTKFWDEQMKTLREAQSEKEKDVAKQIEWEQNLINNDTNRSELGKFIANFGVTLKNMSVGSVSNLIGNIAPMSLIQAGVGQGAKIIAASALRETGKKTAPEIAKLAAEKGAKWAMRTGTMMNSLLSGGDAANTAYEHVMNMSDEELRKLPDYKEKLAQYNGDEQAVRDDYARTGMWTAAVAGMAIGYIGAKMPGSMERNIEAAVAGRFGGALSHLSSALIGAAEEGGVQAAGNIGAIVAGADVNPMQEVAQNAAMGLVGEGMGSVVGVMAGRRGAPERETHNQQTRKNPLEGKGPKGGPGGEGGGGQGGSTQGGQGGGGQGGGGMPTNLSPNEIRAFAADPDSPIHRDNTGAYIDGDGHVLMNADESPPRQGQMPSYTVDQLNDLVDKGIYTRDEGGYYKDGVLLFDEQGRPLVSAPITQTETETKPTEPTEAETETETTKTPIETETETTKTPVETETETTKTPVETETETTKTPVETTEGNLTEEDKTLTPKKETTEEKKPVETKTEPKSTEVDTLEKRVARKELKKDSHGNYIDNDGYRVANADGTPVQTLAELNKAVKNKTVTQDKDGYFIDSKSGEYIADKNGKPIKAFMDEQAALDSKAIRARIAQIDKELSTLSDKIDSEDAIRKYQLNNEKKRLQFYLDRDKNQFNPRKDRAAINDETLQDKNSASPKPVDLNSPLPTTVSDAFVEFDSLMFRRTKLMAQRAQERSPAKKAKLTKEIKKLESRIQKNLDYLDKAARWNTTKDNNDWLGRLNSLFAKKRNKKLSSKYAVEFALESNMFTVEQKNTLRKIYEAYEKSGRPWPSLIMDEAILHKEIADGIFDHRTNELSLHTRTRPATFIHELYHSLTTDSINELSAAAFSGDVTAGNRYGMLQWLFKKAQEVTGLNKETTYGFKNIYETYAELAANPEFANILKKTIIKRSEIPTSFNLWIEDSETRDVVNPSMAIDFITEPNTKKSMSVWNSLVNWIKNALNTTSKTDNLFTTQDVDQAISMYDAFSNAAGYLMEDIPRIRAKEDVANSLPPGHTVLEAPPNQFISPEDLPKNIGKPPKIGAHNVTFENGVDQAAYIASKTDLPGSGAAQQFLENLNWTQQDIDDRVGRINDLLDYGQRMNLELTIPDLSAPVEHISPTEIDSSLANSLIASINDVLASQASTTEQLAKEQDTDPTSAERKTFQDIHAGIQDGNLTSNEFKDAINAKSPKGVWGVIKNFLIGSAEKFHESVSDSALKFRRRLEDIATAHPELREITEKVMGDYRKADNISNYWHDFIYNNGFNEEIVKVANAIGMDPLELREELGYAMAARYAPEVQQRKLTEKLELVDKLSADIEKLRKKLDDATSIEEMNNLQKDIDDLEKQSAEAQEDAIKTNRAMNGKYEDKIDYPIAGGMNKIQAETLWGDFERKLGKERANKLCDYIYEMNAKRLALEVAMGRRGVDAVTKFLNKENSAEIKAKLEDLAKLGEMNDVDPYELQKRINDVAEDIKTQYVPLSGDPELVQTEDNVTREKGMMPNSAATRRLEGRYSMPDNAIDTTFASIVSASQYAGWQPFRESMANMWLQMSKEQRKEYGFNRRTMKSYEGTPRDALVYRAQDGKAYAFTMPDEIMTAIRRENVEKAGYVLQQMGKATNLYARAATQLNFGFAQSNLLRDVGERDFNIRSRTLYDADGNKIKVGGSIWKYAFDPSTLAACWRFGFGMDNSKTLAGRQLERMRQLGGFSTRTETFLGRASQARDIKSLNNKALKYPKAALRLIEGYNRAFDTVSALATYRALLSKGMTEQAATSATLESMDFGKKGAKIDYAKCLYPFIQVKATSGQNALGAIWNPKAGLNGAGVARLAAYASILVAFKAAARAAAGDDKGGNKLDQLSDYAKNNMLNFMVGDGVVSIPLGEGWPKAANVVADRILGMSSGNLSLNEAFGQTIKEGMVPMLGADIVEVDWMKHPAQAFMLQFCPTVFTPIASMAMNRSTTGAKLFTDKPKQGVYLHLQGSPSTAPFFHSFAKTLHDLTGVDILPEQARVLWSSFPGIAQQLVSATTTNPYKEELGYETNNPFFSRFYKSAGPGNAGITRQYYNYAEQINEIRSKKDAGEELDSEERRMLAFANNADKTYNTLKQELTNIKKIKSEDARTARMGQWMKKLDNFRANVVAMYREIEGRPVSRSD